MISRPLAVFSRPKGVRVHTRTRPRNTRDGWAHDDLALLDAVAQAHLVHRGEVTATEPVEAAIARIELLNPALNAVIMTSYEDALARAATRPSGRLAGVPYLLKNLVVERAGTPFTEGSRFLAGNTSTITSELVRRLEHPGLIVLGRTNSPEFGMVPACEPLLYGPTRNPWSTDHSTSGSRLWPGSRLQIPPRASDEKAQPGGWRTPGSRCTCRMRKGCATSRPCW